MLSLLLTIFPLIHRARRRALIQYGHQNTSVSFFLLLLLLLQAGIVSSTSLYTRNNKKVLNNRCFPKSSHEMLFFVFFFSERWILQRHKSPGRWRVNTCEIWSISPPTFPAMRGACQVAAGDVDAKPLPLCTLWLWTQRSLVQKVRGGGALGVDWQIRGVEGVASASIVLFNSRFVSHGN